MKMYRESIVLEDQEEAYVHFMREMEKVEKERAARLDSQLGQEKVHGK